MVIYTSNLGLAAFVKMNKEKFVGYNDKNFQFESDKTIDQWEVEYLNSCCKQHDSELVMLRNYITNKNK